MNSHARPQRIFVVDDHPVVRLGLVQMIDAEVDLEVCGEAATAPEAVAGVAASAADLVIVDISLNGGNGLELTKQLKASDPTIKVLVSSVYDERQFAQRALRAGADGYIMKDQSVDVALDAVRRILGGSVYLSEEMSDRMLRTAVSGAQPQGASAMDQLSDRELEVFDLLGRGVTTREAADRLNLSVKTIETYRENIKIKLSLDNNNELICRAAQWVAEQTAPQASAADKPA
jgi:DNA-binding NarL/FixJ family response regulator